MGLDPILDKIFKLKDFIAQEASKTDKEGIWPAKGIKALQDEGLGGLVVPRESGGLGQGLYALARSCEVISQSCASTAMCFGMHHVGTAVIAAKATPYQKEKYLEPIARGKHITTIGLSEPGTGAHFYYPQTQLQTVSENELKVTGSKTFVTNGGQADSYVFSTVAVDPQTDPFLFSCVVVDGENEHLEWGTEWKGLGMRGNSSRSLAINDAFIPAFNLLGKKGDQLWFVFNVVAPYFLTAMAGTYLGIAQAALDEARNHLRTRIYSHSGASLGEQPVLQHRLGTLWAKVERTRQIIYNACREGDNGSAVAMTGIMAAKAEVANCATAVVNEALTLTGGMGYRENGILGRLLRDARAAHVMAPTTDLLYTWIGRSVLDLPILSD